MAWSFVMFVIHGPSVSLRSKMSSLFASTFAVCISDNLLFASILSNSDANLSVCFFSARSISWIL
eukprot:12425250-Heterocapsa_arctica.AAC.1